TSSAFQSILMLAWRTTCDHLSVSAFIWAASSCEELKVGSKPIVATRSLTSGSAMIRATCLFKISTTSFAVPAGTNAPIQNPPSWPGYPASAMVGTSGKEGGRLLGAKESPGIAPAGYTAPLSAARCGTPASAQQAP